MPYSVNFTKTECPIYLWTHAVDRRSLHAQHHHRTPTYYEISETLFEYAIMRLKGLLNSCREIFQVKEYVANAWTTSCRCSSVVQVRRQRRAISKYRLPIFSFKGMAYDSRLCLRSSSEIFETVTIRMKWVSTRDFHHNSSQCLSIMLRLVCLGLCIDWGSLAQRFGRRRWCCPRMNTSGCSVKDTGSGQHLVFSWNQAGPPFYLHKHLDINSS